MEADETRNLQPLRGIELDGLAGAIMDICGPLVGSAFPYVRNLTPMLERGTFIVAIGHPTEDILAPRRYYCYGVHNAPPWTGNTLGVVPVSLPTSVKI